MKGRKAQKRLDRNRKDFRDRVIPGASKYASKRATGYRMSGSLKK